MVPIPQAPMRVAIYIRVSTKLQEDKYSLTAQKTELTRYANEQGWEIIDTFKDVDSGGKFNKAGLDSLLDCIEDGRVDVVLCVDQDRLSRLDTVEWEILKDVLRKNDVKIAEPGRITDLANEDDEFISDIKNLIAKREKRAIVRRMMRGKRQFTREGRIWGKQPDEYNYDRSTKELSVNENYAWLIPYIDELYLDKGYGVSRIAKELNKICKTPNGSAWSGGKIRTKLKCKAYHGVLERTFSNGETITVEDVYPKLRTEETYNKIIFKLKNNYSKKPATPHFLRDVVIRCAHCGRKLSLKKNYVTDQNKEKKYTVHQLIHANDGIKSLCDYENVFINLKRLKKPVIEAIKGILTDENTARQFIESDFDENQVDKLSAEIKRLEKQKQSIQEKMDRLLDLYLDGTWSKEKLDDNKNKLEKQLAEVSRTLEGQKHKQELILSNQLNYDAVVQFLSVAERFDVLLDELDQQKLIGGMFPSATLDIEKDIFTLHALLPQNVMFDVKVKMSSTEDAIADHLNDRAEKRYREVQAFLISHPGMGLKALSRATGHGVTTLQKDQELFGPFKNLAENKLRPELREERIRLLEKSLSKDPNLSIRNLEEKTGINRKMISKLIKEEGLRKQ